MKRWTDSGERLGSIYVLYLFIGASLGTGTIPIALESGQSLYCRRIQIPS